MPFQRRRFSSMSLVNFVHARCGLSEGRSVCPRIVTAHPWVGEMPLVSSNVPSLLQGGTDRLASLFSCWSPDGVIAASRSQAETIVEVRHSPDGKNIFGDVTHSRDVYSGKRKRIQLSEFFSARNNLYYLANIPLHSLLSAASFSSVVDSVILSSLARSRLLPRSVSPVLYYGTDYQKTPLHFDPTSNLLMVLKGTKRVRLYAPADSNRLRPRGGLLAASLCRLFKVVPAVYSRLDAFSAEAPGEFLEVDVHEGNSLWIPACWWHAVSGGDSQNVAVTFGFLPT